MENVRMNARDGWTYKYIYGERVRVQNPKPRHMIESPYLQPRATNNICQLNAVSAYWTHE